MFLVAERVSDQCQERELADKAGIYAVTSRYWPPIGVERMDLYLTPLASHRLFDAHSVRLQSAVNEVLQYFTVSHSGSVRGRRPICAGLFTIYDHNHTHYWEGLSFGGTVTVTVHYAYTQVVLTSPAPIFFLIGDADPIQHLLFDEIMANVARHRAEAHESDAEYARRLARADPYMLFLAALNSLHKMARRGPPSMSGNHHIEVQRAVQRMIDAVRKLDGWPEQAPQMEDLL